ncbi:VWA domain-containing protein [Algivirga pacifica]|uniref:VWA domain-containing protein n=1 Tax=Algivirga pacifica TaxID=1162670 RepID=A0ABP9D7R6_9BACT
MNNYTEFSWDWLSPHWFSYGTLTDFEWGFHYFLYLIPFIPLLWVLRWLMKYSYRQQLEVALPGKGIRESKEALLRYIPFLFLMLSLACWLIAMARPQKTSQQVESKTEGIDIILVMDISQTMKIEDFTPNRLEAAKEVAKGFIKGRSYDRIGLVIFSGEAVSYAPLTVDYSLLEELVGDIHFEMIEKGGTAIGEALGVALNRMKESESKSKVVVLLSDGDNNAGSIDPTTAAELCHDEGVKIYSIGVGKEGKVPYGRDIFGMPRYVEQRLDETTLRTVAQIGQGQYFRATNNRALQAVFSKIDEYEKSEVKTFEYKEVQDFYRIYMVFGAIFLFLWLLTKSTFMTNVLED